MIFIPLLITLTLLLDSTLAATEAKKKTKNQEYMEKEGLSVVSSDEAAALPDYTEETTRQELFCSACWSVQGEVSHSLQGIANKYGTEPKGYQINDALDAMCKQSAWHYGLKKNDKGLPTTSYTRSLKVEKVKGGWINTLWEQFCNELIEKNEDSFIRAFRGASVNMCPECPVPEAAREEVEKTRKQGEEMEQKYLDRKAGKRKTVFKLAGEEDDDDATASAGGEM
eukprot:PhF_6_TR38868/c0_g1_i1/m.58126